MSKHLKRLAAPKKLIIHRKESVWTIKPSSGNHPIKSSIPLGIIIRDYLKLADNLKETRRIISNGEILVDGSVKKDYKFPCGLMDVISIPRMKQDYRILYNQRGKLVLIPIKSAEAGWKLCRIENKTILKKKQVQLNLHDGRNKLVSKDEYKTGDVIKYSFKDKKISDTLKFEKGSVSIIIGGSHIGEIANIQDFEIIASSKSNIAKMKGKTMFSTLQEYVFPIGKEKPIIQLPEVKVQ
jgi:small subunit ribosomal protein S4e